MTGALSEATLRSVEIIAHRGASHDAPENTLAAVRLAWAQAAEAVEIDVHRTRDDRLVVIHDPDTRRTTGVARLVAEASLAELQQLDAGSWKARTFAGERIPGIEDVFALVPPGRRLFVEVKSGPEAIPALVRAVEATTVRVSQLAVIAFDLATAQAAKRALPRCEVCWIIERNSAEGEGRLSREEVLRRGRAAGLDGLDLEARWVDETWVQQIRRAGFKLYVWTVDDAALAQRLVQVGVDGITTNRPGWLRERLRR